jgi:hypothetical protein
MGQGAKRLFWLFIIGGIIWFIGIPAWREGWIQSILGYIIAGMIGSLIGFFAACILAAAHDPVMIKTRYNEEERKAIARFQGRLGKASLEECRDWASDLVVSTLEDLVADWRD